MLVLNSSFPRCMAASRVPDVGRLAEAMSVSLVGGVGGLVVRSTTDTSREMKFMTNARVHVDGLKRCLLVLGDVNHRQEALHVHVEPEWTVGGRGGVRQVGAITLDDNALKEIRESTGRNRGGRQDAV